MIRKRRDNTLIPDPETNPEAPKQAVALQYDPAVNMAPKVIAKGKGHVAENILAAAQNNSIPVYRNKSLVNLLMALDLDKEIPAELYTTVAEVLAYIYRIDKKHRKTGQNLP
ncbi:MAG: EscU/YscU/HrcU family type III secretion system export apparatus switch protein [Schwartzia sp.]|nr:EscU/YscU/HrcU family type III secretion system export apparatus switch protein [Schwartzia sp. (in: firmicutes)]